MNSGTGHFSQVVWKESTLLGIGRAVATTGRMKCAYIVGRYKPAGNFLGKFRENVLKGSFDAGSFCSGVSKRRKLFEQHENAMVIDAPISADDAWNITGSAEFRDQHTELSNSKKKSTVNHKTN